MPILYIPLNGGLPLERIVFINFDDERLRLRPKWPIGSRMPSEPVTRICFGEKLYHFSSHGENGLSL